MSAIGKTIEWRDDHPQAASAARPAGIKPASYFRWKGSLDRFAAAALLVPGLPLIALLVIVVRLTSRGPGIYRQARVGKDGRRFLMYKIRTMRCDAESATGPVWTQPQDPRVTSVGWLLRKLHLDELPQLVNVLKGEMSLVGPRPERPEFVCVLGEAVPGYRNRLAVRPGITGLAQINLPPDTDLVSVQRKVALDCEYIERGGPWLDARLMLCTFLRLFKLPEGWLQQLLALGRDPYIACPLSPPHVGNEDISCPLESTSAAGEAPTRLAKDTINNKTGRCAGAATPASILLQLGSLPDDAAPAKNGDNGEHALRNGNGASHRQLRDKRGNKRSDRRRPR
jgi:lipopolysaccharide/colanic/teichoic acid biosynthesis glycosyltransferase